VKPGKKVDDQRGKLSLKKKKRNEDSILKKKRGALKKRRKKVKRLSRGGVCTKNKGKRRGNRMYKKKGKIC